MIHLLICTRTHGPYDIIKSKRIKTSEIIVDADKVTIRTPLNKDISEIRKLILDKASWILKKQKEYKEIVPQIVKPTFQEGSTLQYLGKDYTQCLGTSRNKDKRIVNIRCKK
jgi:predicted metal-dependent hydrolase